MNYKTKQFTFKYQMVDYIANYYSDIAQALTEQDFADLEAIYMSSEEVQNQNLEKMLIGEFKDFDIYRVANGDWLIKRLA